MPMSTSVVTDFERAALVPALEARLALVEEPRRRARATEWLRLGGYLLLGTLGLAGLAGAAVGSLWLLGNYVTRSPWALGVGFVVSLAAVVTLTVRGFRALTRWREGDEAVYAVAFRDLVVAPTLSEVFRGFRVGPEAALDAAAFDASALFSTAHDRFETGPCLSGEVTCTALRVAPIRARRHGYSHDRDERVDIMVFKGLLAHLARPVAVPGTVRLVESGLYEGADRPTWGISRRAGTVRAQSGLDAFDRVAAVVLDRGATSAPPLPEQVYAAWLETRAQVDLPIFVSLNAAGIFLAVAVPTSDRWPLEPSLSTANRAEELAADVQLLGHVVRGLEHLARAFDG